MCHPKSDSLLAIARTAAVVVRSTQTISCGDGSTDTCIREDVATERQVTGAADETDLWRFFDKAPTSKADIIIQFIANNRADASPSIVLRVQDSDRGDWVYSDSRSLTDIENDVGKLLAHFIERTARSPKLTKDEYQRTNECTAAAEQLDALKARYQKEREDYDFKNTHLLDAQMDECKLHWQDWVCLKRGANDGLVSYAKEWNESGEELHRKLNLEYEDLKKMEGQIALTSGTLCK